MNKIKEVLCFIKVSGTTFNTLIISALMFASAAVSAKGNSDSLFVSGTVTDAATGEIILGARVISGPYTSITDEKGVFRVRVQSPGASLTAKSYGYSERIVPVQGREKVDVSLYSSHFIPGHNSEGTYTNSAYVTADEVIEQHLGSDVRSINRSAQTGIGNAMFIRGYHSLMRNSQPLFVVDGIVWDNELNGVSAIQGYTYNPLQDIDPNDIESISVIKDASSLYGAKGANGAVIITTKRSRTISTKIGVDVSYGFNIKPSLPDVMNASSYRTYISELLRNSDFSGDKMKTFENTLLNEDKTSINYNKYHNDHNWRDEVYRTGNTQHYGINVQGGDNIALYMISLGYTRGAQTVKGTDFSRLNTRINTDINLFENIKLSTNIYFTHVTRNMFDDGVNARTSPTYVAEIKNPMLMGYRWKNDGSSMTSTLDDVDELGVSNPNALISDEKGNNKQYRFGVSISPEWKITPYLKLRDNFSYTLDNTKEHYFSPRTGTSTYQLSGITIYDAIYDQTISQNSIMNDAQLMFSKNFANSHQVDVTLGWRLLSNHYKNSIGEGYNTSNDKLTNLTGSLTPQSIEGLNDKWNSSNIYLSANYEYQQRYKIWGALSMDGSSRFGADASDGFRFLKGTYGLFPSAGASWDISSEKFMSGVKSIDLLRLRAGFGITGNDDIPSLSSTSYLSSVNYLVNAYGLVIGSMANKKLQWERTKKFDAGIDMALWNDRINISFDYFHHVTDNLLTYRQSSLISGQGDYLVNGGKMQNEGFEFNVGLKALNSKNFKWSVELSGSHYVNEIKSLDDVTTYNNGLQGYTTDILGGKVLTSVGNPVGLFYGYKSLGVFSSDAEAGKAHNGNDYLKMVNSNTSISRFKAGDEHFDDINNDGYIDEKDMTVIGDPTPDLTGAFNNHFAYKNFGLDIDFTYSLGGDIYNYRRQMLEGMTDFSNQNTSVLNRWKMDGQITDMPRAVYGDPMGNSRFSDRWIENGSYLKLKQVRITYSLPIVSSYIEGITVWAAATNVCTWTKYLGADPETSMGNGVLYQGIDNGLLANGRSFYVGLKLNL